LGTALNVLASYITFVSTKDHQDRQRKKAAILVSGTIDKGKSLKKIFWSISVDLKLEF
jgi:hypothetical protein